MNLDDLTWMDAVRTELFGSAISSNCYFAWQQVQEIFDCSASAPDRESFEHFCNQDEQHNDQCGEELADRKCRQNSDGHREFHRHPALHYIFPSFFENGINTDQRARNANDTDAGKRLPHMEPDQGSRQCHQCDSYSILPFEAVVMSFVVMLLQMRPGMALRRT